MKYKQNTIKMMSSAEKFFNFLTINKYLNQIYSMKEIIYFYILIYLTLAQTTSFLSSLPTPNSGRINRLRFDVSSPSNQPYTEIQSFFNEEVQGQRLVSIDPLTNSGLGFLGYENFFQFFGLTQQTHSLIYLKDFTRNHDGTHNNLDDSKRGSAHIPLSRRCPAFYKDNLSEPYFYEKSPRQLSNFLGQMKGDFEKSRLNMTMAFTIWGQFLDHDISLTQVNESQVMNIDVPKCDQYLDPECEGDEQIPFRRSIYDSTSYPRNQMNIITSWVDGSQIYGSSKEVGDRLRRFKLGKMKQGSDRMLPKLQNNPHNLLDAGDVRANQNIILTSYHTVFMREHNRLCEEIVKKSPGLSDQQIYQAARNYVIGLIQKITFHDFLPLLLGPEMYNKYIGEYNGYDKNAIPDINTEFSTASYRIGHSLIVNKYPFINRYGEIEQQNTLNDMFFRPDLLSSSTIDNLLRGLSKTYLKQKSPEVVDEVRNLLISGPNERHINLDLYSLNLQRSSDHGIPYLNQVRQQIGLKRLQSFAQLTLNEERANKLTEIYGSPNNCDLWIGIISEDSHENGILGETGAKIVGEQFSHIRNGDRFWFENDYPASVISEIISTTFSEVIMRNTGVTNLQENIFKYDGQ